MSDFNVNTIFAAVDRVSKSFNKQSKSAVLFGDKTARAFNKASRSGNKFGGVLKGVLGANLISKGFGSVVRGVRNVVNEFIDFDDAIVSASAKFKGLNLTTREGRATLEELRVTARKVGETTQFTSAQAASGLDFLALAGFNAQQAMVTLPGTVNLATVANIDLARSTDIATDALGAFNLKVDDTDQLQKNFTRLNDVMALTMSRTNTNIEDMFEAIKKGAPSFTSAGQSVESFNALLGIMANSGVKGSEAGTQLRNMLSRLAAPSGEASRIIKDLNVNIADSEGNFRDVVDIISDFETNMKGMGEVAKTAALATVFGLRGITGQTILLTDGAEAIRAFRDELIDAGGTAKKMAEIIRNSLGNRLKALKSASIELGFKILEAFDKRGRKGIDALTAAVRNFNPQPVIQFVESAIRLFTLLFKAIKPILPFFDKIVKGLIAVKIAMIAVNIVMLANPVSWVIALVALLTFTLVSLALEWDSVVSLFNSTIKSIGNWFKNLWDELKLAVIFVFKPILEVLSAIGKFVGFDTSFLDATLVGVKQIKREIQATYNLRNNPALQRRTFIESQGGLRSSRGGNVVAPNLTEIESRQQIGFKGQLNIAGAPQGSTVSSRTVGGPDIDISLSGVNP